MSVYYFFKTKESKISVFFVSFSIKYTVILLPHHPASLMYKNPQRCTQVHDRCPVGCKDRSINRSEGVFVEYPVRVISVAVLVAVV